MKKPILTSLFGASLVAAGLVLAAPVTSIAAPFGAPDTRSAAMGKTGVAAADNVNAGYFNPALLATFAQRKSKAINERIAFPSVSAFGSSNLQDLVDIEDQDYESELVNAVNDFNGNQNLDQLLTTLESLSADLNSASGDPFYADAQAGMIFKVPDRFEGGAFYFGRRMVVDGNLNYTGTDAALIDDYIEEAEFVASGGAPATLHPELYQNGQLANPNDTFTSSADAAGLLIQEIAISMAWEVELFNTDMFIGFTPKAQSVTTYEYAATATSGDLTQQGEYRNKENFNLDLGWAKRFGDQWLLGVTAKNIIPQDYRTESNASIALKPQVRFGAAYESSLGKFAVDLDVLENAALSLGGDPTQELSLGAEWQVWKQKVRVGMVSNLAASGGNSAPLFTFGMHFELGPFYSDLSLGQGSNQQSFALQLGAQF